MAYVRTLRGRRHGRQAHFVPGGLACAAARPLSLSGATRRLDLPPETEPLSPDAPPCPAPQAPSDCPA